MKLYSEYPTDEKVRESLKNLIMPYVGEGFGFIVRTNAEKQLEEIAAKRSIE